MDAMHGIRPTDTVARTFACRSLRGDSCWHQTSGQTLWCHVTVCRVQSGVVLADTRSEGVCLVLGWPRCSSWP